MDFHPTDAETLRVTTACILGSWPFSPQSTQTRQPSLTIIFFSFLGGDNGGSTWLRPSTMTLPIDNAPRPLCSVITILDEGRAFVHKARALPSLHDRHSAPRRLEAEVRRPPHRGQLHSGHESESSPSVWGRRKPLVISSVAPNNSLTAPLMHSKMPIETADRRRPRETGGRVAERDVIFICRKGGGMPVYSHGKLWPLSDFRPNGRGEERNEGIHRLN